MQPWTTEPVGALPVLEQVVEVALADVYAE
jgi:hypothetical protein